MIITENGKDILFTNTTKVVSMSKSSAIIKTDRGVALEDGKIRFTLEWYDVTEPLLTSNDELFTFLSDLALDDFDDPNLVQAKLAIFKDYGHYVFIYEKGKSLYKFCRNINLSIAGATIM